MAASLREQVHDVPLPQTSDGWATILADPPWRFTNRTGKVAPEHRRLDRYATMDLAAICALPVAAVAAKNAHLYLWVPNALLPEGLEVMRSWGVPLRVQHRLGQAAQGWWPGRAWRWVLFP